MSRPFKGRITTPRPQMSPPRDRYIYYPGTLEVPEAVAVNIRGRAYKIAAEVDVHTPEAGGVIFPHGHKFGGHALYLKDTVTDDYPGERPWAIAGATVRQVIFDVSGDPYLELEMEALAMMKRD